MGLRIISVLAAAAVLGTNDSCTIAEKADDAKACWADAVRQTQIMAELRHSGAKVLVTLGDQPLKHFVYPMGGQWSRLTQLEYGKLIPITLDGLSLHLLPRSAARTAFEIRKPSLASLLLQVTSASEHTCGYYHIMPQSPTVDDLAILKQR